MTSEEWNSCSDPQQMLEFLRGKASDRKLRLFACACCRWVGHLEERDQALVERDQGTLAMAENNANGLITHDDLYNAWWDACEGYPNEATRLENIRTTVFGATLSAAWADQNDCDFFEATYNICHVARSPDEEIALVKGLHDIWNPFHPATLNNAWLTPNVVSLAQAMYDERAFDRMPILADALEEAGCSDASILEHCRSSGEHVRGCWVVDLVLGKE